MIYIRFLLRGIFLRVLNIGFGNMVSLDKIVSILAPDAAPVKRIIKDGKNSGELIDATCGRKTQSVIVMDSGHVVISALRPELLENRVMREDNSIGEENF